MAVRSLPGYNCVQFRKQTFLKATKLTAFIRNVLLFTESIIFTFKLCFTSE
jgi:hypothetical protein